MNLYLRLLWVILRLFLRPAKLGPLDVSRLRMHVLPNDLDCNMHMNNGRYLTLMDLGRLDLIFRSGLYKAARAGHWIPILNTAGIRFRLELPCFQAYDLETRILGWDEAWFTIEQRFILRGGEKHGAVAAIALVRGAFFNRDARELVPVASVKEAIGYSGDSPDLPDYAVKWLAAQDALKQATSGGA